MRGERRSRNGWRKLGAILLVASGLLSGFGGCVGSGPSVVLVPAIPGQADPIRLAESVKAKVFVDLADGTTTISKNRVVLPAGGWYFFYDLEENDG